MKLRELEPHEKLAFLGLVRAMTQQDGQVSSEEANALKAIADAVGRDEFWAVMKLAQDSLPAPGDVSKAAETVTRPEIRRWIYEQLLMVAECDGVVVAEEAMLQWLIRVWSLE